MAVRPGRLDKSDECLAALKIANHKSFSVDTQERWGNDWPYGFIPKMEQCPYN